MEAVPRIDALTGSEVGLGRLRAFGLRTRVWWSKDRLTRALADGSPSVASRELALRAGQLTAKRTREVVAASIEDLLEEVMRRRPVFSSAVPVNRRNVRAARALLVDLADRLRDGGPVRPQGMAQVVLLLTDPERPLFGLGTRDELADAIIQAGDRLNAPRPEEGP
jgi:hypothetical protein